MSTPAISLLIPVYNGGEYFRKLLECLVEQTFTSFEVVCIDDGSTDGSLELVNNYAAKDCRFRSIMRETKGGTAVAGLKYGLPYCQGEYFFFLSQDDLVGPDFFEILYAKATESGADAVVPDMVWYREGYADNEFIIPPGGDYDQVLTGRQAFLLSMPWKIHGFYLRKTKLLKKVGYDDSFLTGCECNSRKYLFYCNEVVFCKAIFSYRQDNKSAITKKFKPIIIEDIIGYLELLDFMVRNKFPRGVIGTWRNYTADLFDLYRSKVNFNYSSFTKEERALAVKILRKARNRYLWFSLRHHFRKRYRPALLATVIKPSSMVNMPFTDLPFKAKCRYGRHSYSGDNFLVGNTSTEFGSFCSIAGNVSVGLGEHPLNYLSLSPYFYQEALGWRDGVSQVFAPPCKIGNDVWIGQNAFIRAGVSVGDGAAIGAGSVVLHDVPPYAVVGGVPARIIRYRFDEETIKDLLRLRWWELNDDVIKRLPWSSPHFDRTPL